MAGIIVCCLLMHCISGKSPKQIPVHILMSVGGQYPCIHVFWKCDGIWCWVDVHMCVCVSTEPYWLLMSAMEVVLVQFFALAAVHITRRLNEISTLDSVRWAQKRDLWW